MRTETTVVAAERLAAHRARIKRAGGVIVRSSPVGKGYSVTVTYR